MIKNVHLEEMYPIISEMLENNGRVTIGIKGVSMQPMLYNSRDKVTLVKPEFPLKKHDIPFYRRENGQFILHRIIKAHKNGCYTCRGDNQWEKEYPVSEEQIIGVVESFNRNGKEISVKNKKYLLYTKTWRFFHHFKGFYKYLPIKK